MRELFGSNLDLVVKHAAAAVAANSNEVKRALDLVIVATDFSSRANAAQALRVALVAQAGGHEATSHDGSTYAARCEHAREALAAWDA
jgi:hypothetical protein